MRGSNAGRGSLTPTAPVLPHSPVSIRVVMASGHLVSSPWRTTISALSPRAIAWQARCKHPLVGPPSLKRSIGGWRDLESFGSQGRPGEALRRDP